MGQNVLQKDSTTRTIDLDTMPDESLESKVIANARDSSRYEKAGNKYYLFGDAYVEYQSMNLKAEYIVVDYDKNLVTAFGTTDSTGKKVGTPIFKDGQQEFNAEKIIYNLKTKKGKIFNVLTKQGDLLVFGNEIKRDSTEIIYMRNLKCIPCQYEDAKTVFRATKAKIIPNDKIVTGPMYLEISGVPTPLVLPFGYFPNTKRRHNGILIPFVGNSPSQGYFLKDGGFYWGINEKTDMVIKGDIYSNGSWGLRTINNYNVLYKFIGAVNLGYSEFIIGDKDIPLQYNKQRSYSIAWMHTQDNKNNPSVRFSANVNYINQNYNKYNSLNTGQYLTNTFQSNINFTKSTRWSSLSINATHSQSSVTKITTISFPQLTFNVNRFFPFKRPSSARQNVFDKLGISYLLEARNTLSDTESVLFKGNIEDKLKYGLKHTLPISTNFNILKFITVTPALNFSSVMYTKSILIQNEFLDKGTYTQTAVVQYTVRDFKVGYDANFTTALSTKVFMDYYFKSKLIKQVRHLLIPSLTYMYRPDFGNEQYGFWKHYNDSITGLRKYYSIFQNNIFGGPAQGKQNSLSISLNNNLEAKIRHKTDTGYVYNKVVLIQNLGITTFYNFAADSMRLGNININGRTKIWKFFDLVGNAVFDPYGYDLYNKREIKMFAYNYTGELARFTTGNLAITASFSSDALAAMKNIRKAPNLTNGAERGAEPTTIEGKLPWNLMAYYNVTFDRTTVVNEKFKFKLIQALNFSGSISVTKNWKLGVTSGYDFTNGKISYTSMNIYRDLKCWEARIDWVPFGFNKRYSLTINLKTSMLSDLKIPRQRQWFDNF